MSIYTHAESKLYIDQLEEKVCISAPSHHAHIPNADAPTVAAELLKAAGQESVIVPKAYEEVVVVDADTIICGTGPEMAAYDSNANPNWLYNKAANFVALAQYIESAAREAVEKAEAEAAEKKLQERRDALAKLFSHGVNFSQQHHATRRAIDAYIELEDKLAAK